MLSTIEKDNTTRSIILRKIDIENNSSGIYHKIQESFGFRVGITIDGNGNSMATVFEELADEMKFERFSIFGMVYKR